MIRNDRKRLFRFASLQSGYAERLLGQYDYRHDELSSVLLVTDGVVYRKSRAALQIARSLDRAWPLFYYHEPVLTVAWPNTGKPSTSDGDGDATQWMLRRDASTDRSMRRLFRERMPPSIT